MRRIFLNSSRWAALVPLLSLIHIYFMAKKRLPQVLYVRANHDLYRSISAKVMAKFKSFTPDVEVCSVDEAYLDLTGTKLLYRQNYIKTAQMIRQAVWDELHLSLIHIWA